jgi:histone H3/H4
MASSSGNDDDLTIPRAAINKMIKETLPNVRVANDARELVVNCCTEFIHLVSSEANEICNKSEKKTISPEHVIQGRWGLSGVPGEGPIAFSPLTPEVAVCVSVMGT